jgi:RNA polymerase sigma factor (sigma-70 family)
MTAQEVGNADNAAPRSRLAAPRRLLRLRSDAAQESFVALAVSLRSSPPRDVRAWLIRVARNAAIDVARRRKARSTADGDALDEGSPLVDGIAAPQHVMDELESVVAGIRELPESQRTALLMRELAGHSYREIGDLLELDEEAVRGLIARARMGLRAHREAAELPCAAARAAITAEPDGRRHDKTVRRHVRGCAACRSYRHALRDDAKALKGLVGVPAGGIAGGGAVVGGLAAKGALLGTAMTQMTAACAVSVCAVGGVVLLAPGVDHHHGGRAPASTSSSSRDAHRDAAAPARAGAPTGGSADGDSTKVSAADASGTGLTRSSSNGANLRSGDARAQLNGALPTAASAPE